MAVSEQESLTLVHCATEMDPVNSGWYDLVAPPACQGSVPLKNELTKEWHCTGCNEKFGGKYETQRHIDTAGMEVRCRYCDKVVNASPFVLRRHVATSLCLREWEKRGLTGERTVDGAFRT